MAGKTQPLQKKSNTQNKSATIKIKAVVLVLPSDAVYDITDTLSQVVPSAAFGCHQVGLNIGC